MCRRAEMGRALGANEGWWKTQCKGCYPSSVWFALITLWQSVSSRGIICNLFVQTPWVSAGSFLPHERALQTLLLLRVGRFYSSNGCQSNVSGRADRRDGLLHHTWIWSLNSIFFSSRFDVSICESEAAPLTRAESDGGKHLDHYGGSQIQACVSIYEENSIKCCPVEPLQHPLRLYNSHLQLLTDSLRFIAAPARADRRICCKSCARYLWTCFDARAKPHNKRVLDVKKRDCERKIN